MSNHKESIQSIIEKRDDKWVRILKLDQLSNLIDKVSDIDDFELDRQIVSILKLLNENAELKGFYKKHYKKQHQALKAYVRRQFGFLVKGALLREHLALGIGAGIAVGAVFSGVNAAFIAVGLALGLAVGTLTGNRKEKEEEEKENLY